MKLKPRLQTVILLLFCLIFSSLAGMAQNQGNCETGEFGHNPHVGQSYAIRGISLYVEQYGKGEPLVLLHGNGGSMANFACQIPFFEKNYHIIAIDSRAQGKSVDRGDSLSFEMMADDVSALLDNLKLDSCNVLGWSDGGIIGLMLAMRHPEKVRKLAVTGANLWPDTTAIRTEDFIWMRHYHDSLGTIPHTPEVTNSRKLVALDLFQPNITKEQLKQIHCPTLVIGGDHDIIPPEHTTLISRFIPGSYLWIVPASGHATLIDHKDLFNQVVDDFFGNGFRY